MNFIYAIYFRLFFQSTQVSFAQQHPQKYILSQLLIPEKLVYYCRYFGRCGLCFDLSYHVLQQIGSSYCFAIPSWRHQRIRFSNVLIQKQQSNACAFVQSPLRGPCCTSDRGSSSISKIALKSCLASHSICPTSFVSFRCQAASKSSKSLACPSASCWSSEIVRKVGSAWKEGMQLDCLGREGACCLDSLESGILDDDKMDTLGTERISECAAKFGIQYFQKSLAFIQYLATQLQNIMPRSSQWGGQPLDTMIAPCYQSPCILCSRTSSRFIIGYFASSYWIMIQVLHCHHHLYPWISQPHPWPLAMFVSLAFATVASHFPSASLWPPTVPSAAAPFPPASSAQPL